MNGEDNEIYHEMNTEIYTNHASVRKISATEQYAFDRSCTVTSFAVVSQPPAASQPLLTYNHLTTDTNTTQYKYHA